MSDRHEVFYAKIMLFGEYSVICNSMGLTIPYAHFKGELEFVNDEQYTELEFARTSNKHLKQYLAYLKDIFKKKENRFKFDLQAFEKDIKNGLYFESSIPQGYGIGSSGALCAALYSKYSINGIRGKRFLTPDDILNLKDVFSQMETYFHGVSSGIDPLLCYVRYPLLIRSKTSIETVGIPRNKFDRKGAIFLINSGKPGKTGPLVNLFFSQLENEAFNRLINNTLIPTNDACINALLDGEMQVFFENLEKLSKFQFEHFQPMIPNSFIPLWKHGLDNGDYYLKLCGSGGGGFLLGLTANYAKTKKILGGKGVEPILVYKNS